MNKLDCRKQKINGKLECKKTGKIINVKDCANCAYKEYKCTAKGNILCKNKKNTPSQRTKALSIPKKVKLVVWERDSHRCIFCKCEVTWNLANSHFIKRSHGGLGIPENIFCTCLECHHKFDDTPQRKDMLPIAREYLKSKYENWNEKNLIYKK